MFAVDLLEFLRRRLHVLLLIEIVQTLIVELVRGLIDEGLLLAEKLIPQRTGAAAAQGNGKHDQRGSQSDSI